MPWLLCPVGIYWGWGCSLTVPRLRLLPLYMACSCHQHPGHTLGIFTSREMNLKRFKVGNVWAPPPPLSERKTHFSLLALSWCA